MRNIVIFAFILALPFSTSVLAIAPDDKDAVLHNHPFYDPTSSAGACTDGNFNISGGSNLEIIWNYFLSRNFTPEQTSGIIGNLLKETIGTLDPRIRQGGELMTDPYSFVGSPGRGIAQWEYHEDGGGRWWNLLEYAERSNRDPLSLDLQLDFIMFEMADEPSVPGMTGGTGNAGTAYEMFQAMTSTGEEAVEEASFIFQRYYEVNSDVLDYIAGRKNYEEAFGERIGISLDVYADMAGTGTTGITCGPGGGISFDIIEGDTADIPCQGNVLGDREATGYQDGVAYNIRICEIELPDDGSGPWVNSQISGAMSQMFESAYVDGVSMDGGGFRTMESQIQLRISNGCPDIYNSPASSCDIPTARPGYSNHQMGFAIDFNGVPLCPSSITVNGESFCQAPDNPTWVWLNNYANRFGLLQLRTEAWHWSIDGG